MPAPKASAETWVNLVNGLQKGSLSTRLGIPMLYGIDAIHGHNNVYNATIFPHNVALGVTRQADIKKFFFFITKLSKHWNSVISQIYDVLISFCAFVLLILFLGLCLLEILSLSRRLEKQLLLKFELQEFLIPLLHVLR